MRPYLCNPWATAQERPGRLAVVADDETCTFAELVRRADDLCHGLHARGVADGAVLATDIPSGPRLFALALTALRYGYGLFPVDSRLVAAPFGPALLGGMGTALHITARPAGGGPALTCPTVTDDELASGAAPRSAPPAAAARAGYLAFATSGTTGDPQAVPRARPPRPYKGVAVSPQYAAGAGLGPHLMANPTFHLGTLGPALYALQAGSAVVVQRAWSPGGFAELIDRHGADSAMLSLDLLLDVLAAGARPRHPLRALFHGGAACPPQRKREAIALLGPVLHEYYGTSRSTLTEITTEEWLRHPGSVGRPLPGIGIEIRDAGRPVPPGTVGTIHARLRAADRERPGEPLLDTEDLGLLDDDGYLHVLGRAGEEGERDEARLEYEIRLLAGVCDVVVVGGADPVCHVETVPDPPDDIVTGIRDAARRLGVPIPRIALNLSGSLPRTPSGKIRRVALRAPAGPGRSHR